MKIFFWIKILLLLAVLILSVPEVVAAEETGGLKEDVEKAEVAEKNEENIRKLERIRKKSFRMKEQRLRGNIDKQLFIDAMSSDLIEIRIQAAAYSGRAGIIENKEKMLEMLGEDRIKEERIGAILGLSYFGGKDIEKILLDILKNEKDDWVRIMAARGLGIMGLDTGYDLAVEMLGSSDEVVQMAAIYAISSTGRKDGAKELEKIRNEKNEDTIEAALAYLKYKIADDSGKESILLEGLTSDNYSLVMWVIDELIERDVSDFSDELKKVHDETKRQYVRYCLSLLLERDKSK